MCPHIALVARVDGVWRYLSANGQRALRRTAAASCFKRAQDHPFSSEFLIFQHCKLANIYQQHCGLGRLSSNPMLEEAAADRQKLSCAVYKGVLPVWELYHVFCVCSLHS